jgi:hypothetical protein
MNDLFGGEDFLKSLIEVKFNDLFDAEVKSKNIILTAQKPSGLDLQQSMGRAYRIGGYENGIIYLNDSSYYKRSFQGKSCIIEEYLKKIKK